MEGEGRHRGLGRGDHAEEGGDCEYAAKPLSPMVMDLERTGSCGFSSERTRAPETTVRAQGELIEIKRDLCSDRLRRRRIEDAAPPYGICQRGCRHYWVRGGPHGASFVERAGLRPRRFACDFSRAFSSEGKGPRQDMRQGRKSYSSRRRRERLQDVLAGDDTDQPAAPSITGRLLMRCSTMSWSTRVTRIGANIDEVRVMTSPTFCSSGRYSAAPSGSA